MKVTFDIECTPEEARHFLGLPDVAPMQEAVINEMQKQMIDNMRSMDPETIMKTWFPASIQSMGEMQKMFWSQLGIQFPDDGSSKSSKK